jgi:HD-GYP domain-containing protein (c-di-GMP phosphodiesterase class II)
VIVSRVSPVRVVWYGISAALVAITLLTLAGTSTDRRWDRPELLFGLVAIAALVCIVGATIVIALADHREMAEIGLLGSALMAASVLPLVHALVTPDVLYDHTEAFRSAAFLSLPVAVAVSSPLLVPRSSFGRWAARRWRDWTLVSLVGVFTLASVLVFFPDAIVTPSSGSASTIIIAVGMAVALGLMSRRQLRYYELGRQGSNLIASISMLLLGVTALLPLADTPYTPGFWWLHVVGALGVIGTLVGLAVSKHLAKSAHELLAPLLVRDPLAAFELGLSPVVHTFVADLELKDQMTRDHVVRTCELALRVGERFHMTGSQLRDLGLAALLHDVGKVDVPDEILKKPGPLTEAEYEVIKLHSADGERMLALEPTLASAAHIVRSHHERVDGGGYPDGLVGGEIPLASRIIAACDALDAMTHDRQYRTAMPVKMAFAILREFSGTQWDPAVVDQVIAVLPTMPTVATLDEVGRVDADTDHFEHAAPEDITELLALVDAEF